MDQLMLWNVDLVKLVFTVSLIIIIYGLITDNAEQTKVKQPPSPNIWQLLWSFVRMNGPESPHNEFIELQKHCKGNDIFSFYAPPMQQRVVVVTGWPAAKEVLKLDGIMLGRHRSIISERAVPDKGLLLSEGHLWKENRNFLTRCLKQSGYGGKQLETYIEDQWVKVKAYIDDNLTKPLKPLEIIDAPSAIIVWKILFGKETVMSPSDLKNWMKWSYEATAILSFLTQWSILIDPLQQLILFLYGHKMFQINNKLKQLLLKAVKTYKTQQTESKKNISENFVDQFLLAIEMDSKKEDPLFTDDSLFGVVFDFAVAGFEINTKLIAFALMYMARYPDIQDKVQKEIADGIGMNYPQSEDKNKLVYTHATVLEILRKSAIVPLTSIHRTTEPCTIQGYELAANTPIVVNIFAILYDSRYWDRPDEFIPERFIDKDGKISVPEWFIPYSFGKRNCAGEAFSKMFGFIFLTCMMQHYNVKFSPNHKEPAVNDRRAVKARLTMSVPEHYIIFEKRNNI